MGKQKYSVNTIREKAEATHEKKDYQQKLEYLQQIRKFMSDKSVKLADLTKTSETMNFTIFDKEKLRQYLKNPKANEQQLRELSQFLYRLSYQYRRLVNYCATMIDLSAYSVIPIRGFSETRENVKQYLKRLDQSLNLVRKMNLVRELHKALVIAWREDVFYGYIYEDDDAFYIMPLDGRYCRISSVNYDGTFNFAYDFSYFRTYEDELEYWDPEFRRMYELYKKDIRSSRWQELDRDRTICLKVNSEDFRLITPPFLPLFEQIIDLIDLQSIQAVKDDLSIYKLLVAQMETLSGTDEPDDFSVDVDTAIEYFNRMQEELPDAVSAVISPLKIEPIEFKGNTSEDVDMISNSMSNLFKAAGVSFVLDSSQVNSTEALKLAILCDSLLVLNPLLPQIETWQNRYMQLKLRHACPIKYIRVTPYTKADMIDRFEDAAQYGLPVKIAYATLLGFDPLEVNSLAYLENDVLHLADTWEPLQSSHTQSNSSDSSNDSRGGWHWGDGDRDDE